MEEHSTFHRYFPLFWNHCYQYVAIWSGLETGIRLSQAFKLAGNVRNNSWWCRLKLAARMQLEQIKLDISQQSRSSLLSFVGLSLAVVSLVSFLHGILEINQTVSYVLLFVGVCCTYARHSDKEGIAIGLAWSYYIGYLQHMLPFLISEDELCSFQDDNGKRHDIVGWFILVPADGKTPDDIRDKNDRIVFKRKSRPLKKSSGGIKDRTYHLAIYEVQSEDQNCNFYCYMEYAIPLRNLAALADEEQQGRIMPMFSTLQLHYQVDLFHSTIEDILNASCKDVLRDNVQLKDLMQFVPIESDGTDIATEVTKHRWLMKGLKKKILRSSLSISETQDPLESVG